MDPVRILFSDRAFPDSVQGSVDFCLLRQLCEILGVLDVLPRFRKEQSKFFIRRLEETERAIRGSIDDLNVLHALAVMGDSNCHGINSSIRLIGWPSAIFVSVSR